MKDKLKDCKLQEKVRKEMCDKVKTKYFSKKDYEKSAKELVNGTGVNWRDAAKLLYNMQIDPMWMPYLKHLFDKDDLSDMDEALK